MEGAVAAAVAAGLGDPLEEVAAAARGGLAAKAAHLAPGCAGAPGGGAERRRVASAAPGRLATPVAAATPSAAAATTRVTVRNALGLHARPAALLVRTAAGFDADVTVADATNGRGPVSARSLNGVATLGARRATSSSCAPRAAGGRGAGGDPPPGGRRLRRAGGRAGRRDAAPTHGDAEPHRARPDGRRTAAAPPAPGRPAAGAGTVLAGLAVSPGAAVGPACRLERRVRRAPGGPAGDPQAGVGRPERALEATAADVRRARASVAGRASAQDAAIFDAHLLFLEDEALLAPARATASSTAASPPPAPGRTRSPRRRPPGTPWRTPTSAPGRPTCATSATRCSPTSPATAPRWSRLRPAASSSPRTSAPADVAALGAAAVAGIACRRRPDVARRHPCPRARPAGRRRRGRRAPRRPRRHAARPRRRRRHGDRGAAARSGGGDRAATRAAGSRRRGRRARRRPGPRSRATA